MDASTNRRSDAEFQQFLDDFVGDQKTVLTGSLPDLLLTYERDHSIKILDDADLGGVQQLCQEYPDLELGPTELFGFLQAVLKRDAAPRPISPPSPAPFPHSESMPPSSFRSLSQYTPDQSTRRRRRHSDRIKSPSDTSSSSSSSEEEDHPPRNERQRSAPPQTGKAFPASTAAAPPPPAGWLPIRKKTLSDPSRPDLSLNSPLSARTRGGPPSAFGGFARPSPASRRRRGSSGAHQNQTFDDDRNSPEYTGRPSIGGRSTSSASNHQSLSSPPPWQTRYDSRPTSPSSQDEVDNTSFHARAKSPGTEGDDDVDYAEMDAFIPAGHHDDDDIGQHEADEVDSDVMGQGMTASHDTLNPRLSRISTESSISLRTSHDTVAKLRKENTELLRKLKETEKSLAIQGAENERMYEDLQIRLEEAQAEIAQRRKDEKDLKGKERTQLIQISGFEADILSLQRSLENSKTNHANMQKMYNSQCDEAQRLRDLLRDRDNEIHELEENAQTHAADEEKFTREVHALEAEVKRLESDLSVARQAESHLETQKQENLQLKETIDRMKFDLDEARAAAANAAGKSGHSAAASSSSGPGTLSRNLGDELNRRLMDAENAVREEESDEGDSFVETIVTTQRTRKKGSRSSQAQSSATSGQEPIIRFEEDIREYADASVGTDPVLELESIPDSSAGPSHSHDSNPGSPPAYTAQPEPINKAQVLEQAHPRSHGHDDDVEDEYEMLVDALGMRCTVLEGEMETKKAERAKRGLPASPRRRHRTYWSDQPKHYSSGIVNYIFYNTDHTVRDQVGKLAVCVVAAFAVGLVAGSSIYGAPTGINPRDYHLFAQMNTLAGAAGVGEGFLPMSMLGVVEQGARIVAGTGRIPT
ncbi:hypothetical protein I316_04579 [Kwoniella heveanensis BCC8398]|uniref:Uncharacterized protein n=1 Tax=Kwoniella heveanensis BCC8398 TaxID=1296120 RepID=A0A1B9GSA2_9TREE|nr:hypothetical protein I316_04579 [Kwoniella heveanensis BCC8398]